MTIKITKQLATMEDLAIGTGPVVQKRNGVPLTLTKIDLITASILASEDAGKGAALVSMEGGPSVQSAVTTNAADILDRVIRVTSIAEIEAYPAPVGYVFSLNSGGRSGVFDVVAGDFSAELVADTLNGVYIGQADDPTAITKVAKRRMSGRVTPDMFGAFADGVTDDYDVLFATEKLAFEQGFTIEGTTDKTYAFDGAWGIRVDFDGKGCSFVPTAPAGASATISNFHTVSDDRADNVTFRNFSIDGQGKSNRGVFLASGDNLSLIDATIKNCIRAGVGCYDSDNPLILRVRISGIAYRADGGGSADGIYFNACKSPSVIDCDIQDIRRIGIVTEAQGTTKSSNIYIANNRIWNANNCDDSIGEFNGGIWCENTNGGSIENNSVWDIAGNAGQTSGRIRGIVVTAVGSTVDNVVNCRGNTVDGVGYNMAGTLPFSSVFMDGNISTDSESTGESAAIIIGTGLHRVTVKNHQWDGVSVGGGSTNGLVLMGFAGTNDPVNVTLDGLSYKNLVVGSDLTWSHVSIFSGNLKALNIYNCLSDGFSLHIRENANMPDSSLRIDNSHIIYGGDTDYGALKGTNIFLTSSKITLRSSESKGSLFSFKGSPVLAMCSNVLFDGCIIEPVYSAASSVSFSNCTFINGCQFRLNSEDKTSFYFSDSTVDEYDPTQGFIYTNFNNPTDDRLFVRNTDFTHTLDVTPLQKRNNSPQVVVLNGNTTTATSLHDFGTIDQDVNNVLSIDY